MCATTCLAFPKALYVKKGDTYTKYNFGVAENLKFSNDGKTLNITGYSEAIDLEAIDYITFTAPADNTAMTPSEQKEHLVEIGDNFYKYIEPIQHGNRDLVCMIDKFIREYQYYYLDPMYYDVHGTTDDTPATQLSSVIKSIGAIVKGDVSAIRTAQLNGVELYQCSDWFGVFKAVATPLESRWEKVSDADYLEVRFPQTPVHDVNGDGVIDINDRPADYTPGDFIIKITTSDEYTDWTEIDFVGRVPKTITAVLSKDETTIATLVINPSINNTAKTASIITRLYTGVSHELNLYVENTTIITNDYITSQVRCSFDNLELVNANAKVNGVNLTNYPNWKEDFDNTHDGYDNYDETTGNYEWIDGTRDPMIAHHFTYATGEANILGSRLYLSGKISYIGKLYDVLNEDSWIPDAERVWDDMKNTLTYINSDRSVVEKQVSHLNNYADIYFTYGNRAQVQGYITWDLCEDSYSYETDSYWDDEKQEWIQKQHTSVHISYEAMPLITFPDLTSFPFEDYFNGTDFSRLVNDYNDILDQYYSISGNTRPSDNETDY